VCAVGAYLVSIGRPPGPVGPRNHKQSCAGVESSTSYRGGGRSLPPWPRREAPTANLARFADGRPVQLPANNRMKLAGRGQRVV
jgi:hypothetical protein